MGRCCRDAGEIGSLDQMSRRILANPPDSLREVIQRRQYVVRQVECRAHARMASNVLTIKPSLTDCRKDVGSA